MSSAASAGFSGAVKLADVSDYLAPSLSCVKPIMKEKDSADKNSSELQPQQRQATPRQLELELEPDAAAAVLPRFSQLRLDPARQAASVSLSDCLACSGCVTSAETVLITQQSTQQFLVMLEQKRAALSSSSPPSHAPVLVVSLSPQSRASLAHHFSLSALSFARRLTGFLQSMGVDELVDASCALDLSLLEARREFVQRHSSRRLPLPLLASECPGWVCYAEKTQGAWLLPHLSRVKSPQQAMGAMLKRWWSRQRGGGLTAADVLHVSVQPCFDKKLEASREEHRDAATGVADVDLVLSTGELLQLLEERLGSGRDVFASLPAVPLSASFNPAFHTSDPATSGGYADHVFRYAAAALFHRTFPPFAPLPWTSIRGNSGDCRQLLLTDDNGRVLLRFGQVYGFRHLQALVRGLKGGKAGQQSSSGGLGSFDYVEVMACPAGCVNGGGQIKEPPATRPGTGSSSSSGGGTELRRQRETIRAVAELYRSGNWQRARAETGKHEEEEEEEEEEHKEHKEQEEQQDDDAGWGLREVGDTSVVRDVYSSWLPDGVGGEAAVLHLHTSFRDVKQQQQQDANALSIRW